ncbi:hypothetical protein LMG27952_06830 [Paraburkholderia hiiakae]|uniref:Uncharacterized protein n=1 Tax=Paraburkholderia hiiakae TaxID=1081782 RepID=A0ABN7IH46_9BURK|nr:hypothetical protein LMG27952_06830 [Paraburkholderia hiiakae]
MRHVRPNFAFVSGRACVGAGHLCAWPGLPAAPSMRYGAGLIPQQGRSVNRQELVEAVAAGSGDSKAAAGELVNAVFEIIAGALTQGDSV